MIAPLDRTGAVVGRSHRPRNKPNAVDGKAVRWRKLLKEMQHSDATQSRRPLRASPVIGLAGLRVEAPEMNDACEMRGKFGDLFHHAPHIAGMSGADGKDVSACWNSAPGVAWMNGLHVPEARGQAPHPRSGGPQRRPRQTEARFRFFGGLRHQCRRFRQLRAACDNHRVQSRSGLGQSATQNAPLNRSSLSKLLHFSCEMQGSSCRTSSSKSHQPFNSPKIKVKPSHPRVPSKSTSVPWDPSSCLTWRAFCADLLSHAGRRRR